MIANDNKSWWKENETGNDIRKSTYNVSASRFGKSELLKESKYLLKEGGRIGLDMFYDPSKRIH